MKLIRHGLPFVLLVVIGVVHLHLYEIGYKFIPKIGLLFLANVIIAWVLALAMLIRPRVLEALGAALFALGTLVGYVISLTVGLFNFNESGISYSGAIAIISEVAMVVVGLSIVLPEFNRWRKDTGSDRRLHLV